MMQSFALKIITPSFFLKQIEGFLFMLFLIVKNIIMNLQI